MNRTYQFVLVVPNRRRRSSWGTVTSCTESMAVGALVEVLTPK
jgi:hypothetical protein